MSLAQHVTANEGIDRVPPEGEEDGTEEILWRTLSYDVFPPGDGAAPIVSPEATLPNTAAYKVSATKRAGKKLAITQITTPHDESAWPQYP